MAVRARARSARAGRPRRGRPGRGRRRESTPIALGWAAAWWRSRAIHSPSLRCSPTRVSMRRPTVLTSGASSRSTRRPRATGPPWSGLGPGLAHLSGEQTPPHQHQRAQRSERRLSTGRAPPRRRQVSGWPQEPNREARKTWVGPANRSRCSSSLPKPRAHRHRPAPAAAFVGPRPQARLSARGWLEEPLGPIVNRIRLAYGGSDATPCLSAPASGPLATV